jgi:NAD(P)-dependent dehydrogenase (short-subunit alcohol dehydrogenase family)
MRLSPRTQHSITSLYADETAKGSLIVPSPGGHPSGQTGAVRHPTTKRVGMELNGATAVVTGGASGIGLGLAGALIARGARVAIVDLDATRAQAAAESIGAALGIGTDVGKADQVAAMVAQVESELGEIDLYFSNAGIMDSSGLGDEAEWARTWSVHCLAHVFAAREVMPKMVARKQGVMVVTASAVGLSAMMQSAPYTVTKHAAVSIAEWLAIEYDGDGVSVHCLAPQAVNTPLINEDAAAMAEAAAAGEILTPEAVAEHALAAIDQGTFLILSHPDAAKHEQRKVADRDRWIAMMRRYRDRITG